MLFAIEGLLWYLLTLAGGFAGWGVSRRLCPSPWVSWPLARLLGWALPAYLAWYAGLVGLRRWAWVGLPLLLAGLFAASGLRSQRRWLVELEGVGLVAFCLLAWLRSGSMNLVGTEKPMDLAILASLLRPQALPPEDPWLSGYPLPYYHWGFLPWVLPVKLAGFFPDEASDLLVPTLAALVAQLAYGWARSSGLSPPSSTAAAAATVFLGTAQGWSDLLLGRAGFFSANLWEASRGIAHTITEFPLFTFHLGDLHPHLLCQPWVLAALLSAEAGRDLAAQVVTGFLFAMSTATNPWAGPPLALALALLALARPERPLAALLGTGGCALGGLLLFFPAWAYLPAGPSGLGWVHTPTTLGEAARVLGPALLPLFLVAVFAHRQGLVLPVAFFAFVAGSLATGRPLLILALVLATLLALWAWPQTALRPPLALALAALACLGIMELVYLKDPYGPQWYRMNTVFKLVSFAFLVLPVPSWRLLAGLRRRGLLWLGVLPFVLSAPQLATVAAQAGPWPVDFSGLGWMAPGEAEAARWLARGFAGDVLVEGVGEAYSDAARLASASGVPTVLGWENHERLWRPGTFGPELARRREGVHALYRCQDPQCVQQWASQLGATLLVIGSVERRLYPELNEEALRQAGELVFCQGHVALVRVAPPRP